jgi:hypothetical protein
LRAAIRECEISRSVCSQLECRINSGRRWSLFTIHTRSSEHKERFKHRHGRGRCDLMSGCSGALLLEDQEIQPSHRSITIQHYCGYLVELTYRTHLEEGLFYENPVSPWRISADSSPAHNSIADPYQPPVNMVQSSSNPIPRYATVHYGDVYPFLPFRLPLDVGFEFGYR